MRSVLFTFDILLHIKVGGLRGNIYLLRKVIGVGGLENGKFPLTLCTENVLK